MTTMGAEITWVAPQRAGGEPEPEWVAKRDAQTASICKALVEGWEAGAETSVKVITGGITNALFMVTNHDLLNKVPAVSEGGPRPVVLLRVYGDNTDLLIDRKKELSVLRQLNTHGFGAQVLATFSNGRIEEYLDGYSTMDYTLCVQPLHATRIARLAARFHGVRVEPRSEPAMWDTLREWYQTARSLRFEDASKRAAVAKIDYELLSREIDVMRRACAELGPVTVFMHGDLLPGNIMTSERDQRMTFIDFEYSTYGYQGFDIGNHWNECMGLECDLSLYPSEKTRRHFVVEYAKAWIELGGEDGGRSFNDFVETLFLQSEFFVLASHIYWSVWSIIQARYSKIDFDYVAYFEKRWRYYREMKPSTFAKLKLEP